MPEGATNEAELEAVYVRLYIKAEEYKSQGDFILKHNAALVASFNKVMTAVNGLDVALVKTGLKSLVVTANTTAAAATQVQAATQTVAAAEVAVASTIASTRRRAATAAEMAEVLGQGAYVVGDVPAAKVSSTLAFIRGRRAGTGTAGRGGFIDIGEILAGLGDIGKAVGPATVSVMGGLFGWVTRMPEAFNSFAGSIRNVNRHMTDLLWGSRAAVSNVQFFRLSLAAIVGFSAAILARFDDSMTRTLARMGDFDQRTRPILERASFGISNRSITSATELNTALGNLAAGGMNAAMAAQALTIAENYAVAGNVRMVEATRQLVDIQNSLGMSTANVEEHYANMTRISDTFLRVHQLVDVSVEQVAESFRGRYAAALRDANMSLEQGAALVATYAAAGIHGAEAGTMGAQVLMRTMSTLLANRMNWERLLGAGVATKPVFDTLTSLIEHLSGLGTAERHATLGILGFNQQALRSLMPLLDASHVLRGFSAEMGNAAGTTERMAELIRGDFMSQFRILWNNIVNLLTFIGSTFAPTLASINDGIKEVVGWFMQLNPAVRAFAVWLVTIAAVAGPALSIVSILFGKVFGIVSTIGGLLFSSLGLFVTMMTNLPVILGVLLVGPVIIAAVASLLALSMRLGETLQGWHLGRWMDSIPSAKKFFDSLQAGWFGVGENARGIWHDIVDHASAAFNAIGGGFARATGFFWNFSENIQTLVEWLGTDNNWQKVIIDLITLTGVFAFNMFHNLAAIFDFISRTSITVWATFWEVARDFGWAFVRWLGESLGTIFSNVWHNIAVSLERIIEGTLLKLNVKITEATATIWNSQENIRTAQRARMELAMFQSRGTPEQLRASMEELAQFVAMREQGVVRRIATAMPSNLLSDIILQSGTRAVSQRWQARQDEIEREFMAAPDRTRRITEGVTNILEALAGPASRVGTNLATGAREVRNIFGIAIDSLRPLFQLPEGVRLQTGGLPELNLTLPENVMGNLQERMNRVFSPMRTEQDLEAQFSGRRGPGSEFKQLSPARFVLGGAVNMMMDQQRYLLEGVVGSRLERLITETRLNRPQPILER